MAEANSAIGADGVRTVRILPVGGVPAPRTAPQALLTAPPNAVTVLVKTRKMASQGFHQALAALQDVAPVSRVDPAIAEAGASGRRGRCGSSG
ncbi:hypothetical protein [Streptomyces erythrochromogenes]|uniref:hypothetical protein n=1 Tax=Streptomyces erythrochromogenes TaxID=285574 RepID=UPI0033C50AC8